MTKYIKRMWRELSTAQSLIGFLLLFILIILIIIPVINLIVTTFTVQLEDRLSQLKGSPVGRLTFFHWKRVLSSKSILYRPLLRTLLVGLGTAMFSILLGTSLAWLVNRTDMSLKRIISGLAILPYILPSWAFALSWLQLFQNRSVNRPGGFLEYWTGIQVPSWLVFGPIPIIVVLGLHYYPFVFVLVSSAFRNIDSRLEESALILGASPFRIFKKISLPIVLPALLSSAILAFSQAMGTFGTPALLGIPVRYFTISTQIYSLMTYNRSAQAFVLALCLITLLAIIIYINMKLVGTRKSFVTITGKGSMKGLIRLGKFKHVTGRLVLGFLISIILFPLAVLFLSSFMLESGSYDPANFTFHYWIGKSNPMYLEGEAGILRNPTVLLGAWNSIRIGIIAGLIVAGLGILLGYVIVRGKKQLLARALDTLSFIPLLIPSITFGAIYLSLFAVKRSFIPELYGTLALLILATIAKRIPYASRTGISSMFQLAPELEETAIMQGSSWLRRFRKIIFPMVRSGFVAGFLIVLTTTMRELSLFLILMSPHTTVLTAVSFSYAQIDAEQLSNGVMSLIVIITLVLTGAVKLWEKYSKPRGMG